ncbi:MAG: hypothetical protein ACC657_09925 [Thiohalomonadales bacterium]
MARGKQELGETVEAKALFVRLLELEPSWKESHIEPYLKKLMMSKCIANNMFNLTPITRAFLAKSAKKRPFAPQVNFSLYAFANIFLSD